MMMATSIDSGEESIEGGRSSEIHSNKCGDAIIEFLHLPKGRNENKTNNCEDIIAYIRSDGDAPTIIFCNGFHSEMSGRKAIELEKHCRSKGRSFVRFDYRGMGLSSGNDVNDMVLGDWVADTLAVIDSLSSNGEEKVLLVGSSMGGWIALHAAMQRPDQVVGVVGVAVAPDFIRYRELELTEEERADYEWTGCMHIPSEYSEVPYMVSNKFVNESRKWNLLEADNAEIPVACPVRLLQGKRDSAVPWQRAVTLSEALPKPLVQLNLIDDGDHRLSTDKNIASLLTTVEELLFDSGF